MCSISAEPAVWALRSSGIVVRAFERCVIRSKGEKCIECRGLVEVQANDH